MDPLKFYLGARGFEGCCWHTMTVANLVYMVEVAGLDPLQMVLVGTALELSAFLFEIPTGLVADAYSRKLSVIIGHALTGLGFLVLALFPSFEIILLSQVIWGCGWTFISGAYPAWLSEEIGVQRANQALVRGTQISQVAAFVGIALGIALAHVSLQLPIIVGAVGVLLLAVAMPFLMRENNFTPAADAQRQTWAQMAHTLRDGIGQLRLQPVLVTLLLIAVVHGMSSEGFDRLTVPFLIDAYDFPTIGAPYIGTMDSVIWWGFIAAVSTLTGLAATTLADRFVDADHHGSLTKVLALLNLGIAFTIIAFANLPTFYAALAALWLTRGLRQAYHPFAIAWLNRRLPSHARATMLSMQSQADAIGQTGAGPLIGLIGKYVSLSAALTVSGLVLLPALLLYRQANKIKDQPH